jgi:hypothetical protein
MYVQHIYYSAVLVALGLGCRVWVSIRCFTLLVVVVEEDLFVFNDTIESRWLTTPGPITESKEREREREREREHVIDHQ